MAVPTLYTYTLQQDDLPCGLMTVKLHSEITGLTVPSFSSIQYGETNERYDAIPQKIEVGEMAVDFDEDYSTYLEGFWYKVTSSYAELQFILNEGNGDTHFFWGKIINPSVTLEEHAIVEGQFVRSGSMKIVSLLSRLKERLTSASLAPGSGLDSRDILQINWLGGGLDIFFVKVYEVIASCMADAFGQAYDITDVVLPQGDFEFYDSTGATWIGLSSLYFHLGTSGIAGGASAWSEDMEAQFPTTYDLIVGKVAEFGLSVRHYYDIAASRHRVQLLAPRSYSTATLEVPLESKRIQQAYPNETILEKYRQDFLAGTIEDRFHIIEGTGVAGEAPDELNVNRTVICQWILRTAETTGTVRAWRRLYPTDGAGGVRTAITDARFWNYQTSAYDNNTDTPVKARVIEYFYKRFGYLKRAYNRTYPNMKLGTTQENNHVLRTSTIDDELSTRTFVATEVTKRPVENECTVLWHEV